MLPHGAVRRLRRGNPRRQAIATGHRARRTAAAHDRRWRVLPARKAANTTGTPAGPRTSPRSFASTSHASPHRGGTLDRNDHVERGCSRHRPRARHSATIPSLQTRQTDRRQLHAHRYCSRRRRPPRRHPRPRRPTGPAGTRRPEPTAPNPLVASSPMAVPGGTETGCSLGSRARCSTLGAPHPRHRATHRHDRYCPRSSGWGRCNST